jgi:hypothetical protein
MPRFEPSFALKPLQQVTPAALVVVQQTVAFVGIHRNPQATSQRAPLALAMYDLQQLKFLYRYFDAGQPDVLLPTGELIIRPNLHTLTDTAAVQPASDKLFHGDDTYIVVEIPGSAEVRLLSLTNGSVMSPTVANMRAFESWEIGVMSMGEFVPLLKI